MPSMNASVGAPIFAAVFGCTTNVSGGLTTPSASGSHSTLAIICKASSHVRSLPDFLMTLPVTSVMTLSSSKSIFVICST